jgi:hypothetical protein
LQLLSSQKLRLSTKIIIAFFLFEGLCI